jgi:hypothetical protein
VIVDVEALKLGDLGKRLVQAHRAATGPIAFDIEGLAAQAVTMVINELQGEGYDIAVKTE